MRHQRQNIVPCGFTLIEILMVLAILAVLASLAIVGYQKYIERALGTDIVERFDAARTAVAAQTSQGAVENCDVLNQSIGQAALADAYATLVYGFEKVAGGFRPVLTVCARADQHGAVGVKAARGAFETLSKTGSVESNPVLTDTVVNYALPLTQGESALCRTAPTQPDRNCGAATSLATAPVSPPAAPASVPHSAPTPPKSQSDCQPHELFFNGRCLKICNPGHQLVTDADGKSRCVGIAPKP